MDAVDAGEGRNRYMKGTLGPGFACFDVSFVWNVYVDVFSAVCFFQLSLSQFLLYTWSFKNIHSTEMPYTSGHLAAFAHGTVDGVQDLCGTGKREVDPVGDPEATGEERSMDPANQIFQEAGSSY